MSGISPIPVKEQFDGTGPFFSAAELEFMAENELVPVKPRRRMEEMELLCVMREGRGGEGWLIVAGDVWAVPAEPGG